MPTWVFDVIVIALVVLSTVMSIGRGLIREFFSAISFVIGGLSAWLCLFLEPQLKAMISPGDKDSILPAAILVVIGFLAAYILAAIVGGRLAKLVHTSAEIGALDRLAGAGFGLARGILAAILILLLVHQVTKPGEEPDWIAKSYTYPYLNAAADGVGGALTTVIDLFTGKSHAPAATAPVATPPAAVKTP